jgi:hypothetical protein
MRPRRIGVDKDEEARAYHESFEAFMGMQNVIKMLQKAYGDAYSAGDGDSEKSRNLLAMEETLRKAAKLLGACPSNIQRA